MMSLFKTYFKINFKKETQYRSAALSGVITQLFYGMMFILIYYAFYTSNSEPGNFTLEQMSTYIWLNQAFYMMFKYYDGHKALSKKIVNGDISYQLLRPVNLYKQWFADYYTLNISKVAVRSIPIFIICWFLPTGFGFTAPVSGLAFAYFVISLILGTILVVAVNMFSYILVTVTLTPSAVFGITNAIGSFLAGAIVPLALLPNWFITYTSFLPFRYIADLPYRLYVGSISTNGAWIYLLIQIIWIAICVTLGNYWLNKRLSKLVVQGG